MTVGASADLIDDGGLQVKEDGAGHVLAEGTLAELCARTGTSSLREAFFALVGEGAHAA